MIDNMNPTNQFHPYHAPDAIPVAERETRSLLEDVRQYARANPGKVLGGIAAAAIGLGLLRRR